MTLMDLSDYDLSQLDEEELLNLPEEVLRRLSVRLLNDLKEARERLKQNSRNSSRPPSSDPAWEKERSRGAPADEREGAADEELDNARRPGPSKDTQRSFEEAEEKPSNETRKPGKQPGAEGFGRQQTLAVTATEEHFPKVCARCQQTLNGDVKKGWTAFETLDLEWADEDRPGLRLTNTRHRYYEILCRCGHVTREEPHRTMPQDSLPSIACSEWRLVGPGLAALIVCLAYRMRLSRERIREFLDDWLGLQLAVGTIHNTLQESGAAALSLEEELIQAVRESQLLHADETSWTELTTVLWLWVFSTGSVTAYWIAYRSSELVANLLGEVYDGWLMSDGYRVYRKYPKRLRCWAHLLRKAQGLEESLDRQAQRFGTRTLELLHTLIAAVQKARGSPSDLSLTERYRTELAGYRCLCEQMKTAFHKPTRELATEMLSDWEAIFRVVEYPFLPLTNNEAERALRHWVILRRISYGTRTEEGSRVFAILISVIETCRKRQQSPWIYLATVIDSYRAGLAVPKLPVAKGSE
ncbi:MAG: IS66 family transposase [Gammaproteobacteria bacterium]